MKYVDCFRALARHRTDQIVVASAGNSCQAWWAATRDTEASFYLDASMSLSTMFASGLALARPELTIWAFMGDGAFCMNPGMLMVERDMNLPNLDSLPGVEPGLWRDLQCRPAERQGERLCGDRTRHGPRARVRVPLDRGARSGVRRAVVRNAAGHTFVVLEVEPFSAEDQKLEQPPFDGPELKFRFGRHIEARTDCNIFGYRL